MSRTTSAPATPTNKPASATTSAPMAMLSSPPRDKVAARAYQKWMQNGCPHGCDQQHWLEAEQELRAEMQKPGISRK